MTIAAITTGAGGAVAVIRVSGSGALEACDAVFRGRRRLADSKGGRFCYGRVVDGEGHTVDDVVAAVFRAPHSYTGEDTVEISCHGSRYIRQRILQLLIDHGVRLAEAGEFSMRAVLNGRIDLSQAEAVADIIAAEDRAAHAVAANQMRGGYSEELRVLRGELVTLAGLLELELDFGEEDVEFADRDRLRSLMVHAREKIERLAGSFAVGNVLKHGVGVAIVGSPNVGKSTLLNALTGDDRAMVSDIAGTTRDTLEERVTIDGVTFRFIDTAGLRESDDRLEQMGMERTRAAVERADVVLVVVEAGASEEEVADAMAYTAGKRNCLVINKIDTTKTTPGGCGVAVNVAGMRNREAGGNTEAGEVGPVGGAENGIVTDDVGTGKLGLVTGNNAACRNASQDRYERTGEVDDAGIRAVGDDNIARRSIAQDFGSGTGEAGEVGEVGSVGGDNTACRSVSQDGDGEVGSVAGAGGEAFLGRPSAPAYLNTSCREALQSTDKTAGVVSAENDAATDNTGIGTIGAGDNAPCLNMVQDCDREVAGTYDPAAIGGIDIGKDRTVADVIPISALRGDGLDRLREWLRESVETAGLWGGDAVVSNARHHEALVCSAAALRRAEAGLGSSTPPDLLAQDIRDALHHLGLITGEITTDDLLSEIFSKFCIGK